MPHPCAAVAPVAVKHPVLSLPALQWESCLQVATSWEHTIPLVCALAAKA